MLLFGHNLGWSQGVNPDTSTCCVNVARGGNMRLSGNVPTAERKIFAVRKDGSDPMQRVGQNLRALVWLCAAMLCAEVVCAQGPLRDSFETAETAWREVGSDVPLRIEVHERAPREPHSGSACEFLQYTTGANGTQTLIGYPIGRAAVIPELSPAVWVRSDRAGIQLLVRVVLPRTRDPRTGEPMSTLLGGTNYTRTGTWEQLRIGDLSTLLTQKARVMRLQMRSDVDTGEAFVDRVLLNIYTGGGRTQLSIDDLEVTGIVGAPAAASLGPAANPTAPALPEPGARRKIEISGSVLLADGRPFFPRIVEYRGEPLAFLRGLGFNGVVVDTFPSPELLTEAIQQRLWLVCPPPRPPGLDDPQAVLAPIPELVTTSGVVLAWHLGSQLTGREVDITKRWSDYLRRFDRGSGRPLIAEAETDLRTYSRYVDALVLKRLPLGTSFELNDYATWMRERPKLARPGTPIWSVVQTQLSPELQMQAAGLSAGRASSPSVSVEQVRLLAYHALAGGSRGLLFNSPTRLDAQDPATRVRAAGLELLNYELDAIEPWGASGSLVATAPVTTAEVPKPGTTITRGQAPKLLEYNLPPLPNVQVALLQTERARLLMPLWTGPGAQYVAGQQAASGASFVIPGVPEANDVYRITPGGLPPAKHSRVTGGIRVSLDEMSLTSMLVMTQDPVVIGALLRRSNERGGRILQLQRELSAAELQRTVEIDAQLTAQGHLVPQGRDLIRQAQRDLQAADAPGMMREPSAAYEQARRALRPMQLLQRAHWEQAAKPLGSTIAGPLAVNYNTLPAHWDFVNQLQAYRPIVNQLPGGDFEHIDQMLRSGWQHFEHPQEAIQSNAELSNATRAPQQNRGCLRLSAWSTVERGEGLVESPPLWITSPAVPVESGAWVKISGWIRIPKAVTGSLDGVMVIDSIGGESLAERIGVAPDWRQFVLYRYVPRTGPMTVTVALTGLGEVWLDDLLIEPLAPANAGPPRSAYNPFGGQRR
jgi:hypothetical protein